MLVRHMTHAQYMNAYMCTCSSPFSFPRLVFPNYYHELYMYSPWNYPILYIILYILYRPWDSPGQNSGVGSLSLPQGIFPTQGIFPGLPHCRWILYQLSYQGNPIITLVKKIFFFLICHLLHQRKLENKECLPPVTTKRDASCRSVPGIGSSNVVHKAKM